MTDHQTARRLAALDQVLILTHRRPDGDTIGCASALCLALRQLGKTAWVLPNEDAHGLFTPYLEGVLAPAGFLPQHVVAVQPMVQVIFTFCIGIINKYYNVKLGNISKNSVCCS